MKMGLSMEPLEARMLVVVEPLEVVTTLKHGFDD
jgi:hypothetical protein